jgi:hypothetical protein
MRCVPSSRERCSSREDDFVKKDVLGGLKWKSSNCKMFPEYTASVR